MADDAAAFLREAAAYATARPPSWTGAHARGGPRLSADPAAASASASASASARPAAARAAPAAAADTPGQLWARLSDAVDGGAQGAAVIRQMQRELLESVERLPLDEIELMARRA